MKKAALYFSLLFLAKTFNLSAQHNHTIRCHTDEKTEIFKTTDPEYYRSLQEPIPRMSGSRQVMDVIVIPVHVIIVHPPGQAIGTGVNFSMDHIQSQIDVLNQDFRRTNTDASNTPPEFAADDSMIEFCLAIVDPDGNPTDGVTRHGTNQNLNSNEFSIKSATGWDRNSYLNIWVGPGLGGLLGWAYRPSTTNLPNATLDGIVVASGTFGGPGYGTTNNYDLGRTSTHEVGHYLGCDHVWGGSGGCGNDDGFDDTPNQSGSNFGCPNHPSPTCGNAGDMFMNYMDYVNDDCMNAFTTDQGEYMTLILNTSRSSLLNSAATNCDAGGIPLTIELVSSTDLLCFGDANGTATVQADGGAGGFTYSIDNGPYQTSNIFTGLLAGLHTITAQDMDGSSISIDAVINEPAQLIPNVDSQVDVSCFGFGDGVAIVSAMGGTLAFGNSYQYSIDGGGFSSNNIFDNLSAGPHTIIAQDDNGCEAQIDAFIVEPLELVTLADNISNVSCNGDEDGLISFLSFGGNPEYTYSIDLVNYQPTPLFFDLAPGDYLVTTVDQNNCIAETPFTIGEPALLELAVLAQNDVLCFNDNNGVITVEGTGGNSGYQYSIDNIDFQNVSTFTDLLAGSYTLYVQDENNCTAEITTTIDGPEELLLDLIQQTDAGCAGQAEGTVTVSTNGGVGGNTFTYGTETLTGDTVTFTNIPAGMHTVMVADANACEAQIEVQIAESAAIDLETTAVENASCATGNDGLIIVEGGGGSGSYQYNIDGGNFGTENVFLDLSSGSYTIGVQDDTGCEGELVVEVTAPDAITTEVESQTNPGCSGTETGAIDVLASGGAGSFQYTLNSQTNAEGQFDNLSAGEYTIFVSDANGCNESLIVNIEDPEAIAIEETDNTAPDCFEGTNGSVTINANGGSGVFDYTFNGETNTTGVFNGLAAGTYEAIATDENACTQNLMIDVDQPMAINVDELNNEAVDCFGSNTGSVTVSASGGNSVFEYNLNGQTNATGVFTSLVAGTYTATATDENGCVQSLDVEVTEPEALTTNIDYVVDVNCAGDASGAIQIQAIGGSGNYTFTMGASSNSTGLFEGLVEGNYNIDVVDENNCGDNVSATVAASAELEVVEDNLLPVSCFGENDGAIQLLVSGGNGNFEFTLDTETNTSGLFENLTPGNYSALVTDGAACSGTYDFEITEPLELAFNLDNQTDITCFGAEDGMVELSASGGTGTYTFDDGTSTNNDGIFNNMQAGIFELVVSDESGCSQILETTITEPAEIEAEATIVTDVACNGENNGNFTLNATGGIGALEYTANGETNTTGIFNNLIAGNYPITVVDANGCVRALDIDINEPAEIALQITANDMNNCFGASEGTIQVAAIGGMGNLEFNLGLETNATGYFDNLAAGDYQVGVTDANGCTNSIVQSITEPEELITEISNLQQNNCFGNEEGTVQVNATGGNGVFEFTLNGQTNSTGYFDNLGAGDFEMTIVDGNDCSAIQNISITQPAILESTIVNLTNIDCDGSGVGSVEVEATGGNGSYEFTLGTSTNTTGIFNDLPAGSYEIEVADLNGCGTMQVFNIVEAANLDLAVENLAVINCFGAETAIIQVSAAGGSGNYEFFLDGMMNTTGYFDGLTGGDHEISVVDQDGCSDVMAYVIDQPAAIVSETIEAQSVACFGENNGFVQVIAQGGNGAFQYTLNGETNSTGIFENLPGGNYELLVTDAMACTALSTVLVEEPSELEGAVIEMIPANCFGSNSGFVQLEAQGGAGDYTYALGMQSNSSGDFINLIAGDYEVMITDASACTTMTNVSVTQPEEINSEIVEIQNIDCFDANGVGSVQVQANGGNGNFQYTLNAESNGFGYFENLNAGTYEIQITDDNGCTSMQSFAIVEGADLAVEIAAVQTIGCFGETDGSIQVSAEGGSGTYEFMLGTTMNTTGYFDNLAGGNYTISVIDAEGCESTMDYEVTQPNAIEIAMLETTNTDCFGLTNGTVNVQGQGGDGNFNYTLNSETSVTGNFENLAAGDYLLVITDNNGCTTSSTVSVEQPFPVSAILMESTAVNCYGAEDGMAQVSGVGGNGNFVYTLGTETNLSGTFENLSGGIYALMVSDANGCSGSIDVTIEQPEVLASEIVDLQSIGCSGNLFGSVQVVTQGGTGDIEYTLGSETNTTGIFENLNVGDYMITAFDNNACTSVTAFAIVQSDDLEGTIINNTPASCFGASDGIIQVGVQSGNGTYTYVLGAEMNNSGLFTNLDAGDYMVAVTDGGGCDAVIPFSITQPNALVAEAIELSPLTCFGDNNAVIQLEAFGGNGPFSFTIGNETNTSGGFENLSAGAYDALVTDQNNCSINVNIVIIEPDAIQSEILESIEPACNGDSNGFVQLEAAGGTFPYDYTIGTETNDIGLFENLPGGNYQVLIEDANGCMTTESISLTQPEVLISGALNITPVECYGGDDGVIFMGADGGTPGYEFELNGAINSGGVFFGLTADAYTVNVTDANGCFSQTVVVISEPQELTLEVVAQQDDTGTGNGSATVAPEGGVGPYVYSIDGINYSSLSIFENLPVGTYTAFVRDSNGCISEVTFTIDMGTYITNLEQGVSDIQLFPNPFTNDLHLKVDLINAQELELRMFTIHGQELYYYKANFGSGTTNLNLDIPNDLPAGAYLVSLRNESVHLGHYKLVKQR